MRLHGFRMLRNRSIKSRLLYDVSGKFESSRLRFVNTKEFFGYYLRFGIFLLFITYPFYIRTNKVSMYIVQ